MSKTINVANATAIFALAPVASISAELQARGLDPVDDAKMGAMLLATGCRSLDEFSATMVNLYEGNIESESLKDAMAEAFPNHTIGDRHGSHYLSLARNGNLQGNVECRYQPPKAKRKARARKGLNIDLSSMTPKQRAALAKISPEIATAVELWESAQPAAE